MTNNKLLPIGTQCIMRRDSQVTLYLEIFGDATIETFCADDPNDQENGEWVELNGSE